MQKRFLILFTLVIFVAVFSAHAADTDIYNCDKGIVISNKLFSLTLPENVKNSYILRKKNDGIFIYDKESKQAGFGGFAFGLTAYKNPSDYAVMPGSMKVGELVNKKGTIYDIVLIRPTDVQYDYVNKKSKTYDILYDYAETAAKTMIARNGNKYVYAQGTKGEELYNEVLDKHITAIKEKWDSLRLEKENMSYMYNVLRESGDDIWNKVGYVYYDINADGIEELLIGEIAQGDFKGVIYDIYTMVNRKPAHVISGGARNRYYACDKFFVCNEYSGGANESGMLVYTLVENSTELFPQVGFKYDGYTDSKNPWFISYNFENNEWDNVPETKFKERKSTFDKYERFNFIPLKSRIKK